MKQTRGITLVALVVTIIVLLILAGISIQAITNTGLFSSASQAKKESQRAQVTEWLNLKLIEEQAKNPTGTSDEIIEATRLASDGNPELAKMGKNITVEETKTEEDGEEVGVYFYVQVDEDVYKVEMTGAKFIGEQGKFPPIITLESITSTTNSITVKIKTTRNEDGKLKIYIKSEDNADYRLEKIATGEEAKGIEYTFTGLEQNNNYSIKIVAIAKNEQVKEYTKEITTEKQLVNEIRILPESATLQIGKTLDLSVTILPENAYNKAITWNSSNPEVATIEQNGKVTAVAEGTTTITAIAQDGSNAQGNCTLIVKDNILYLYTEGDERNEITGGWQTWYYVGKINYERGSDYLKYYYGRASVAGGWATTKKIDVSGYTKLKASFVYTGRCLTSFSYGNSGLSAYGNTECQFSTYNNDTCLKWQKQDEDYYYADISNLNGSFYITFGANHDVLATDVTIKKVWLEK